MRLLQSEDDGDFSLVECEGNDIPPYAILSHTWGADHEEVNFNDIKEHTGKNKKGYRKLTFCGNRAKEDGLRFFWIDTCSIDKSSSAELQESINSMFKWYQESQRCYVYLPDVTNASFASNDGSFQKSRWFTRGWTLQELIAPSIVEFFSSEGAKLGDRSSLLEEIVKITGISARALQGDPLDSFSLNERLYWTGTRQTKREEDIVYCLLGIVKISMPVLYGEGRQNALNRLWKEIAGPRVEVSKLPPALSTEPLGRLPEHPLSIRSKAHDTKISSTGLTIVVEPKIPLLDIVFVHGVPGHPYRTWAHEIDDGMHGQNRSGTLYWPRDLAPKSISDARIMTFGYDMQEQKHNPNESLLEHTAENLLSTLEKKRRKDPARPALFVAHGLGGTVVEAMLRMSRASGRRRIYREGIFKSTAGIVFFGTPHRSSNMDCGLTEAIVRASKADQFPVDEIIDGLLPPDDWLKSLEEEFSLMCQDQNWIIQSFQEEVGVTLLGDRKVVDDEFSYLNLPGVETVESIQLNHFDMCRFKDLDDSEYDKVDAALCRIVIPVSKASQTKEKLENSLLFNQIEVRETTIVNAHSQTCAWLLRSPEYVNWLDATQMINHHGFLWIKGKPGTGKSTIMKFARMRTYAQKKDSIVIAFFFNARGVELEKSTIGAYQSLLLQLLNELSPLQVHLIFESLDLPITSLHRNRQWGAEILKQLLEKVIRCLGPSSIVCFIDAVDECEERQVRDMISFLEQIGELNLTTSVDFRVCFASRHYPHITIRKGLYLTLERQSGHNEDITKYLRSELRIGNSDVAKQIQEDVLEKSSGIFVWVVLVVGILNKEYDSGRIHSLRRRLQEIPSNLHELFHDILTRDFDKKEELISCVQWVLFSRQPLYPEQLYSAILSSIESEQAYSIDTHESNNDVVERFLLDSSKGLTEITKSAAPKVQFIHESVKDYLLKGDGLGQIWPELGSNLYGQSHRRLMQCCDFYLKLTTSDGIWRLPQKASFHQKGELYRSLQKKLPLLEYAVSNWLYHADKAAEYGMAEGVVVSELQIAKWIKLDNLSREEEHQHERDASHLYLLAELNMSNLISICSSSNSCIAREKGRYGAPLLAAIASESKEAIRAIIQVHLRSRPSCRLHSLCAQDYDIEGNWYRFNRGFVYSEQRTVLSYLAEFGNEVVFALALEMENVAPNERDENGWSPLLWAASDGNEAIVQLLLNTGKVDANLPDKWKQTPLFLATVMGHTNVVKLLLGYSKIDVNPRDCNGETPLSVAALTGNHTIIELLLNTGAASVNSKNIKNETPLLIASREGWEDAVRRLLCADGIDVNLLNDDGESPLLLAAANGYWPVVEMLIGTGKANFNVRNHREETPILAALKRGYSRVVNMLLEADAVGRDESAVFLAVEEGHIDIVKLLLNLDNFDFNLENPKGQTPLLVAAIEGQKDIVKWLLGERKVNVDHKGKNGQTALLLASMHGHQEIVQMLISAEKVDINSKDRQGLTPLSWAAMRGHKEVVKLLIDTPNIDVDSRDLLGRTPLAWAVSQKRKQVVNLLVDTGRVNIYTKDVARVTPISLAKQHKEQEILKLLFNGVGSHADSD